MGDLVAVLVAVLALALSGFSAWRLGRSNARNQFAVLANHFFQVFERLPDDVSTKPYRDYTPSERSAADLYWTLAFLEWQSSRKTLSRRLRTQWMDYYQHVQVSGFNHPGLKAALLQRLQDPFVAKAWDEYLNDLSAALEACEQDKTDFFSVRGSSENDRKGTLKDELAKVKEQLEAEPSTQAQTSRGGLFALEITEFNLSSGVMVRLTPVDQEQPRGTATAEQT